MARLAASVSLPILVLANMALVAAVGVFGMLTDEPYWRVVGHGPWAYTYAYWAALALNAPSGLAAEFGSHAMRLDFEASYLTQYAIWLVLIPLQWAAYLKVARWCAESSSRTKATHVLALASAVSGVAIAFHLWSSFEPPEQFFDGTAMPIRILALSLSGLWISALVAWMGRHLPLETTGSLDDRNALS